MSSQRFIEVVSIGREISKVLKMSEGVRTAIRAPLQKLKSI